MALILSIVFIILNQTTFKEQQELYSRVRQARVNCRHYLDSLFISKGIEYPPYNILLTVFKKEQSLELWARAETTGNFILIKQYPFTGFSGTLGPKRKQGDLQIPEGFYYINNFNPVSNFHLSLKINYPNRSDSILGKKEHLGGEIRIHGSNVTIGCIPLGDDAIEELYITCVDVKSNGQQKIPVYIFPCKMDQDNWLWLRQSTAEDSSLLMFWTNIKQGYDLFTAMKKELVYEIDNQGQYIFVQYKNPYPWLERYIPEYALCNIIHPPTGYRRVALKADTFGEWLRAIPLKPGNPPIYLFNGRKKEYQSGHYAVVNVDVGDKDLQQCADAVIRLYAEFLFSKKEFDEINFMLTNGDIIPFRKWINGLRPQVSGNTVTWHKKASVDSSRQTFLDYLQFIFMYAGTYSLNRQLADEVPICDLEPGDIIIQPGFPGHAVLVLDAAENISTNEKIYLLGQSFMPAQDFHILKNLSDPELNPWYKIDNQHLLSTPQWLFTDYSLKRF
ncbi:MAG TPA: hypothetical protein ENI34_02055 [candidate division WOR-3 bacterium]|uniref:L,D-TPase catalytic domain-containing protein n=1 Tax=candidate division WOR-3 bacterium TaxID=2052148 RepID=A0A9C9EL21_UNCW3|nr:hypothetical protein [candidate division WOR-3 bacterium]